MASSASLRVCNDLRQISSALIDLKKIATPLKFPHLSQVALPTGFPNLVDICNEALKLGKAQQLNFSACGKTYTFQYAPFSGETGQLIGTTLVFTHIPALRSLTGEINDILENAPLHLIRYQLDGKILRISHRTAGALGIEANDAIGRKIEDLLKYSVDIDTGPHISDVINANSHHATFPLRVSADGPSVWVSMDRYSYEDSETDDKSFILTGTDVTQIVEAVQGAKQRNAWLKITQDIAGIGYWHIDITQNEVFWSEKVFEIHGLDSNTFHPTLDSGINAYHPDDRAHVAAAVEEAVRDKKNFHFVCRLLRVGDRKETVWVESRGEVITSPTNEATMVVGMFRDVTKSIQEKSLLEEFDQLQTESEKGFFSFDLLVERAYWSTNMPRVLGVPAETTPGHEALRNIIVPEQQEDFHDLRNQAIQKATPVDGEFQIVSPINGPGTVSIRLLIGDIEDGKLKNYFGEVHRVS